ncbi:Prostaglandin F synthase [Durusdinium trenchii]|uniref:Prostaglandin F synthase n=1 Tax=Durusdinium trenchii TaxID=1381693 RepID=A0ABP0R9S0_9DINO
MGCCSPIPSSVKVDPFRGMCYAPTPAKNVAPWAEALWGKSGRDDLSAIRQMGFKVLRVYGNDPRLSHEAFLSRCTALGLKVIVAISDFPYTQDPQSKCATAPPYDCFTEVRLQFTTMLKNGFTVRDGEGQMRYHPAIEAIILINEPELKITYQGAIAKDAWSKGYYTKALLSALDGALRAEESLSIMGAKPPFTVVNSFSTCETCKTNVAGNKAGEAQVGSLAALGFMYDFVVGALKPDFFGYDPRHDLKSALQNRWLLGFNTQDTSDVICKQVLQPLKATPLSGLPIWAGEYKAWYQSMPDSKVADFKEDWSKLSSWVQQGASCDAAGAPLRGVSIFEFQVSYYKGPGDHQMTFGLYELGSKQLASTAKAEATQWKEFPVWCRKQKRNQQGDSWAQAAAEVVGGSVPSDDSCPSDELLELEV